MFHIVFYPIPASPTSGNHTMKVKQVKIGRMGNSYRTFMSSGLFKGPWTLHGTDGPALSERESGEGSLYVYATPDHESDVGGGRCGAAAANVLGPPASDTTPGAIRWENPVVGPADPHALPRIAHRRRHALGALLSRPALSADVP